MTEASLRGYPLIRSPVLHYPDDEDLWRQMSRWGPRTSSSRDPVQYMFGADFLVAPCVAPNATEVSMYLPRQSGSWTHLVRLSSHICIFFHFNELIIFVYKIFDFYFIYWFLVVGKNL